MVQLYECGPCCEGNHESCERGTSAGPGVYGGRSCICPCMGRSKEQMDRDRDIHFKAIMAALHQQ